MHPIFKRMERFSPEDLQGRTNGDCKINNMCISIIYLVFMIPVVTLIICISVPVITFFKDGPGNDTLSYINQVDWVGFWEDDDSFWDKRDLENVSFDFIPEPPQSCFEAEVVSIGDPVYVSVCDIDDKIIVDVREFRMSDEGNIYPTIKGINLDENQFNNMIRKMRIIQRNVRIVQNRIRSLTTVDSPIL